jgi:hypothetical protein
MRVEPKAKDPRVRSWLELRRAVGAIAVGLPFVLLLSTFLLPGSHHIPSSISLYYYTPMRNLVVGSLCAIGFFNVCARGYDFRDEVAGFVSAVSAFGLAFFPTAPPGGGNALDQTLSGLHNDCAAIFFSTLAFMCLVLFRCTAANRTITRNKRRRNAVYAVCGLVMVACGVVDFFCHRMRPIPHFGPFGSIFCCESLALEAFGVAWLAKGKTFFATRPTHRTPHPPQPAPHQMAEA